VGRGLKRWNLRGKHKRFVKLALLYSIAKWSSQLLICWGRIWGRTGAPSDSDARARVENKGEYGRI
jgi:hypothetical protein